MLNYHSWALGQLFSSAVNEKIAALLGPKALYNKLLQIGEVPNRQLKAASGSRDSVRNVKLLLPPPASS
jgi:hypothetical protein